MSSPEIVTSLLPPPPPPGDVDGNSGKVLDIVKDAAQHSLYVKSQPLQWSCDAVPCNCTFEKNITLDGAAARVEATLTNARSDRMLYPPRGQELPAIYTVGSLYRIVAYNGTDPFTGGPLTYFPYNGQASAIMATEHWAAIVNKKDWGLAVFQPGTIHITANFFGTPGDYGPADNPTGYLGPYHVETLDWNIQYKYRFDLVLGNLRDLRTYAYQKRGEIKECTKAVFSGDRQHWAGRNTASAWPLRGAWRVALEQDDPQLVGPNCLWKAVQQPMLHINASYSRDVKSTTAQIYWNYRGLGEFFDEVHSVHFSIVPDGRYHDIPISLSSSPNYSGDIFGLRFDPVVTGNKGAYVDIASIILKLQ